MDSAASMQSAAAAVWRTLSPSRRALHRRPHLHLRSPSKASGAADDATAAGRARRLLQPRITSHWTRVSPLSARRASASESARTPSSASSSQKRRPLQRMRAVGTVSPLAAASKILSDTPLQWRSPSTPTSTTKITTTTASEVATKCPKTFVCKSPSVTTPTHLTSITTLTQSPCKSNQELDLAQLISQITVTE